MGNKSDKKIVSLNIPANQIAEIDALAAADKRNRSNMTMGLVAEALAARKASHAIDASKGDRS